MNNTLLRLKIEQRLNKLSSQDYSNIKPWMIIEAFNKAQVEFVRRNLHGNNLFKEGSEQSVRRVDDFQILLTPFPFPVINGLLFASSPDLPDNYLQFNRVDTYASTECCPEKLIKTTLVEEASITAIVTNPNSNPSYEWGETIATISGNKIHLYHNKAFTVTRGFLMYYRQPRKIEIAGVVNPETGNVSPINVESELKDDLVEVIVDDAAAILAADIESFNQYSRENQNAERNN